MMLVSACGTEAASSSDGGLSTIDVDADGGNTDAIDDGNVVLDVGGDNGTDGGEDVDNDGGNDGGEPDVPIGPRPGGNACDGDDDCGGGTYCEFNFGPPYCAPVPNADGVACTSDAACQLADGDGTFCCSGIFGFRQCTPAPGGTCGGGDTEQGGSCAEGGQSDCREDAICLFGGEDYAYCSQFCDPNAPTCAEGSYCFETESDQGLCLEAGEIAPLQPCGGSPTECDEGLFCIDIDPERPQLSFCGAPCEVDSECSDGFSCNDFGICLPDGALDVGESCVEDRFACGEGLLCYGYGTRIAYCTEVCRRDRDCGGDLECQIFDDETGDGLCAPAGGRAPGEACGDAPLACEDGVCTGGYDVYDPGAYCVGECDDDGDCDDGTYCNNDGDGPSYCFPAGDAEQGELCALDPLACAEGHFCVGSGGSSAFCARLCAGNDDCTGDNWCTAVNPEEGGFCVPRGDVSFGDACELGGYDCVEGSFCGDSDGVCIAECTLDATVCGESAACVNFDEEGGRSYCYPFGELGYGEFCGDDVRSCEEGLYCIGRGSEVARCSSLCDEASDCAGGDSCREGVCTPVGDAASGESCAGDPFACNDGLLCLLESSPGAFCAAECTGFASFCGDGAACRFVGYNRNFCMQTGDAGHGDSCAEDQFACDSESWCINAGTENGVCVQTCSFAPDSCPDGTTCRFVTGGLGVCLSAGLSPEDPLNPGGAPL